MIPRGLFHEVPRRHDSERFSSKARCLFTLSARIAVKGRHDVWARSRKPYTARSRVQSEILTRGV